MIGEHPIIKGIPQKLQIGKTVSFAAKNEPNNYETIHSNLTAIKLYYFNSTPGAPANLPQDAIDLLKNHPEQLYREGRIRSGATGREHGLDGNYGVDMTNYVYHIGRTDNGLLLYNRWRKILCYYFYWIC